MTWIPRKFVLNRDKTYGKVVDGANAGSLAPTS